jgi:hypothetical protein
MADGEPLSTAAALECVECGRRWLLANYDPELASTV